MTSPYFSIVMASYLGEYEGRYGKAAEDRVNKFHRAVRSVREQTFTSWELIIVADGCQTTVHEAQKHAWDHGSRDAIRILSIAKQRLWSEKVRNAGIHKAHGSYVLYLDTDDQLAPDHLDNIAKALKAEGQPLWAYFDDLVWDSTTERWFRRLAQLNGVPKAGTSNLVHAGAQAIYWPVIQFRWPANGYDHDAQFVAKLMQLAPGKYLGPGGYMVCHIPREYDI